MNELSLQDMVWMLKNYCGVSEETVNVVTDINGMNENTLQEILFAVSGYHYFKQVIEARNEY